MVIYFFHFAIGSLAHKIYTKNETDLKLNKGEVYNSHWLLDSSIAHAKTVSKIYDTNMQLWWWKIQICECVM